MSKLSIVVPAYNEGEMVLKAADTMGAIMAKAAIDYEIIFVNDGSRDNTWLYIEKAAAENPRVAGISFSRNFGKESAILAGLTRARGDACAVIDCDLQHPPETLVDMYRLWQAGGVDIVEGKKASRGKESPIYKFFAGLFYNSIKKLGRIDLKDSSDFQLLDRRVVDTIIQMPERQRFFRALSTWVGFRKEVVTFTVAPRLMGTSKFNFFSSAKYALNNITSFSAAPMQFVTMMGFVFFIVAAGLGVHTLYGWFRHRAVEGFTTVILLLLIIGAMLMISIGIIGLYIGKIYDEIKQRPHYLIQATVNLEETPGEADK